MFFYYVEFSKFVKFQNNFFEIWKNMGFRFIRKCMLGCKRYFFGVYVYFFIKIGKLRLYFLSFLQILVKFYVC